MRPARALAAALAATVLVAVAAGAALGGWPFARQHLGALLAAAAALVALAGLALAVVAAALRAAVRQSRARGAATSEFLIVIIPFLLLLFGIMQLALASLARLLVSYAAFAAARAAVVFVPQSSDELAGAGGTSAPGSAVDEPPNQVGSGSNTRGDFQGSQKAALMRNAAAYAMIPASPALDVVAGDAAGRLGGQDPASVDRALDAGFGAGSSGPGGALLRSLRKLPYARLATAVTLHDPKSGAYKSKFGWGDPIQARVTYLFYCQIPLANRFAGHRFLALPSDARQDLATAGLGSAAALALDGYYMILTADHTLVNQGRP